MALRTLGTAGTTTLSAVRFHHSPDVLSDADRASLNALIKPDMPTLPDGAVTGPSLQPAIQRDGQLWLPRRGWIKVLNGDYIAVDPATGWPILIAGGAAGGASYVHT